MYSSCGGDIGFDVAIAEWWDLKRSAEFLTVFSPMLCSFVIFCDLFLMQSYYAAKTFSHSLRDSIAKRDDGANRPKFKDHYRYISNGLCNNLIKSVIDSFHVWSVLRPCESCGRNSAPAKGTGYSRNLVLRVGICARGHDRYIFDLSLLAPGRRSDFAFGHRQVALDLHKGGRLKADDIIARNKTVCIILNTVSF